MWKAWRVSLYCEDGYTDNLDGFHGSFYLHKDLKDGAKWVAGPIWDLVCYNREKPTIPLR